MALLAQLLKLSCPFVDQLLDFSLQRGEAFKQIHVLRVKLFFDLPCQVEHPLEVLLEPLSSIIEESVDFCPQVVHLLQAAMVHLLLQVSHEVQYNLLFRILVLVTLFEASLHQLF